MCCAKRWLWGVRSVAKVTVLCVERGFIWKIMGVFVKKGWKLMGNARSLLDAYISSNLQIEANCV